MSIGIIGAGFVGTAVYHGFSPCYDIKIYDKYKPGYNTLEEVVKKQFIFICLPTPYSLTDGKQDLHYIHDVLDKINNMLYRKDKYIKKIIIKSTVLPGTCEKLQNMYPEFHILFNPEFLTERTSILDFINQHRIILAGKDIDVLQIVGTMFYQRFPHAKYYLTTKFEEAELVKYMLNCYFASKVSFMNEIYEICEKMSLNYETVKNMFLGDGRVSNSHVNVPGPDNFKGFGGKCFPKDLNSFINWGITNGFNMDMFKAAEKVNQRVREVKDWETIQGAVSNCKFEGEE